MANIYKKTMRESLEEARDYRDPTTEGGPPKDGGPGSGAHNHDNASSLSYDEWLKQVKGIEKGAHGITGNEHDKYSKEWRAYATESKLTEIVGGKGEMTVTKDGGVMIIKTRDWQTYKAKGWVKREEVGNESLELPATGDTITSNASQEVEGEELTEAWNEKVSLKGLKEFRAMYKTWLKSGVDKRFIQSMEKLYDDMVIGGMYSSRSAEERGILKIDGRTKYKNANW